MGTFLYEGGYTKDCSKLFQQAENQDYVFDWCGFDVLISVFVPVLHPFWKQLGNVHWLRKHIAGDFYG